MLSKKAPQTMARRFLTTSISVKEASEALRHVQESEKKLKAPVLDRSRVWIVYIVC